MKRNAHNSNQPSLDHLVVYVAYSLERKNEPITFEKLVAECYRRFPSRFCLNGYPEWPDSAKVNKCWLRCRTDKGWMTGSNKRGFRVTPAGRLEAIKTQQIIEGSAPATPTKDDESFHRKVQEIRKSHAFKAYQQNETNFSTEHLISSLGVPLEANRVRIREALRFAQESARMLRDEEVSAYLNFVESSLGYQIRRSWKKQRHPKES
jgi:hypothetical protein